MADSLDQMMAGLAPRRPPPAAGPPPAHAGAMLWGAAQPVRSFAVAAGGPAAGGGGYGGGGACGGGGGGGSYYGRAAAAAAPIYAGGGSAGYGASRALGAGYGGSGAPTAPARPLSGCASGGHGVAAPRAAHPPAAAAATAAAPPLAWPPVSGAFCDPNPRCRPYMEDEAVSEPRLLDAFALYAVYDGHGGRAAVDYVCAQLHKAVANELRASRGGDVHGCLRRAFARVDSALKPAGAYGAGSTAAVALVERRADGGATLTVANCGDSHVFLLPHARTGRRLERLSEEHSCKNDAEAARIVAAGGTVVNARVGGLLAVTRAFGDHALKGAARGQGLSAEPFIASRALEPASDQCLLLASDGVFETLSDDDIEALAREALAAAGARTAEPAALAEEVARRLVRAAIDKGSRDNVSAQCVLLAAR